VKWVWPAQIFGKTEAIVYVVLPQTEVSVGFGGGKMLKKQKRDTLARGFKENEWATES